MAKNGGFFSPNRKVTGKDKQVASSMSSGSYGGYIDAGESRGFVSPEQADKMIKNPEAYKMRPSETRYLRESMGLPRAQFFSPSGNEIGQIASATTDLSGLVASSDFDKQGYDNFLKKDFGVDSDSSIYKSFPNRIKMDLRNEFKENQKDGQLINQLPSNYGEQEQKIIQENQFNKYLKDEFGTTDMNYGDKQFFRDAFNEGDPYRSMPFNKQSFATPTKDTQIAMMQGDNLGGPAALLGGVMTITGMGINAIKNLKENFAPKLKDNLEKKLNPEQNRVSIGNKVGGFLNNILGIQSVAAGTLDANQQVSQAPERPKLSYVNPDAKTMTGSEIRDAFKPKNLFGYQDKFGRFDDPGSPLARDRAETIQRVAQNFTSPITADARTIGQIRADQEARMRENARLRNESFKRGERVGQKSADVTYGTNMLSNPAFGFRSKMTDAQKAQYDKSAKDATEMARTDPSLGNVAMQTFNRVSGFFGGPQGSLESIGERQLRLANKEINRPTYQKEAFARKFLGITNEQLKARNLQQIRANAFARNQAFQNEKAQKAAERAARRLGGNLGTGRDGSPGLGTQGKSLPSNPKGFSGYSRKTSPSTSTSTSRSGISRSTSRGQGGGPSSRSRGGTGTGRSSQGSKSSARGARGSTSSRSRGGTGTGRTSTSRKASKASKSRTGRSRSQCDIRTKIDVTSLTNQNLMKDDLATVAYFVQELRGK